MSELRHDPLSGCDVILAAGRARRPTTFSPASPLPADDDVGACPFCPGAESTTPPEVARTGPGAPDTEGWRVRVFPNLYPIVGGDDAGPGATGVHEVVALSPDHARSFGQLADADAVEVMTVLRDRVRAHLDAGHPYAFAIINHRRAAGASIVHPHAQVFALDLIPPAVVAAVDRVRRAGRDLVADDATIESLAVSHTPAWVWCPPASTSPFLIRVAHPAASARFDTASDEITGAVAIAVRDALARLAVVLDDAPYNLVVRTASREDDPYHWYIDVIPRLTVVAGFEMGSGMLVNTVPPDVAACRLRDATP